MKPIIKYISLLLFSGLISPFYNANKMQKPMARVNHKAIAPAIEQYHLKKGLTHYFIYQAIAEWYIPGLTNSK